MPDAWQSDAAGFDLPWINISDFIENRKFFMARRPQLLSEKISALFDAFESTPIPTTERIKNGLWEFANDAKAMEDGERAAETKAEMAALEKKTHELDAINKKQAQEFKSELSQLEAMIDTANAEINRLRAEKEEREKADTELLPEQFRILKALPNRDETPSRSGEVCTAARLGPDEVTSGLAKLKKGGYASCRHFGAMDSEGWNRTIKGTDYIVSRRPEKKYADLDEISELILYVLRSDGGRRDTICDSLEIKYGISKGKSGLILDWLKKAQMITWDIYEETYGKSVTCYITNSGREYLDERGKL
jgi:hypothetical protein